jgi:glucose-6-phosphate-specific signal transduction histidine kinase
MNNIGKHAQADSVKLGLRKGDGAIELLIKDNGTALILRVCLPGRFPKRGWDSPA